MSIEQDGDKNEVEEYRKRVERFIKSVLKENISDADDEIVEKALPIAVDLFLEAKMFYELEEKTLRATIEFAEAGEYERAQTSSNVSNFFQEKRTKTLTKLQAIGGLINNTRHVSKYGVNDVIDNLSDTPFLYLSPQTIVVREE
ncbi:MAG TPA: hypothetical protein VI819_05435 [Patescibacteria group bacterium]|nr:hypothetical protein [Patescibacteria group bacterium]